MRWASKEGIRKPGDFLNEQAKNKQHKSRKRKRNCPSSSPEIVKRSNKNERNEVKVKVRKKKKVAFLILIFHIQSIIQLVYWIRKWNSRQNIQNVHNCHYWSPNEKVSGKKYTGYGFVITTLEMIGSLLKL